MRIAELPLFRVIVQLFVGEGARFEPRICSILPGPADGDSPWTAG
jgi:hypothetical protein